MKVKSLAELNNQVKDESIALTNSGFTATLQSGTLSGNVVHTLPTVSSSLAPLSSPAFTGTPTINGSYAISNSTLRTELNASGTAPIYACRAWVNFKGTGTVAIRASGNVSSITDNGIGSYTVNFTTAMPDINYSVSAIVSEGVVEVYSDLVAPTTTTQQIITRGPAVTALMDQEYVSLQVFR